MLQCNEFAADEHPRALCFDKIAIYLGSFSLVQTCNSLLFICLCRTRCVMWFKGCSFILFYEIRNETNTATMAETTNKNGMFYARDKECTHNKRESERERERKSDQDARTMADCDYK